MRYRSRRAPASPRPRIEASLAAGGVVAPSRLPHSQRRPPSRCDEPARQRSATCLQALPTLVRRGTLEKWMCWANGGRATCVVPSPPTRRVTRNCAYVATHTGTPFVPGNRRSLSLGCMIIRGTHRAGSLESHLDGSRAVSRYSWWMTMWAWMSRLTSPQHRRRRIHRRPVGTGASSWRPRPSPAVGGTGGPPPTATPAYGLSLTEEFLDQGFQPGQGAEESTADIAFGVDNHDGWRRHH
jgi:hypothetical protein